jgi:hypothetical protein
MRPLVERQTIEEELRAIAVDRVAHRAPSAPRFVADDATPEAVGRLLSEQHGRFGGVFFGGRPVRDLGRALFRRSRQLRFSGALLVIHSRRFMRSTEPAPAAHDGGGIVIHQARRAAGSQPRRSGHALAIRAALDPPP